MREFWPKEQLHRVSKKEQLLYVAILRNVN